ncbi:6-phosphofructo-2-kinase 1 [Talaromyces proteolyticus]|uniref:6-phosphofructo-2-kinase 1 n=1 Tax=Talaromyces proteolyticus TaxID=1131652 RepID=A0AAD4KZ69_9EURO|nr:6-phosphofructo-2-kinase 1 [Talaromyces proteolyticus]KAH8704230.1 6-phosphofructo-2-kinase 1 [Talaromyces proteolyticus]
MSVASSSPHASRDPRLSPSPATVIGRALGNELHPDAHKPASPSTSQRRPSKDGVGMALSDTPLSTAPSSPQIRAQLHTPTSVPSSTAQTPKPRATTLDIPGLTRSKVSPDGRIPERDVGSKLVIVMVGLPARGKSYVTKKLARYLNWLQHDTRIFNVGERRRLAAGNSPSPSMLRSKDRSESSITQELVDSVRKMSVSVGNPMPSIPSPPAEMGDSLPPPAIPTEILVNGERVAHPGSEHSTPDVEHKPEVNVHPVKRESIDQSASFFDPHNQQAVQLREQVALATLDELLDYILDQGGSVGILDATNSTLERRKTIMDRIRERAGPELGVLFLESRCVDPVLLESNMRLKLSGPDYHDQDPVEALEDFKKRVAMYDESYVPLGEYEEKNDMAYVQMIDVGRKVVAHQTNGFLSSQVVYYLMNFNLSPRQIWITRHGESIDNQLGRIGGDSELSENGHKYGEALARFIDHQKGVWEEYQAQKAMTSHFPPHPGDSTPPNPSYGTRDRPRNFCVWSSMMKRAIQTTSYFNDDDYDIKQMRMLDELYAGKMEGMTYEEIKAKYPEEYENRRKEKLQYRYPGPGGEGYLDVINRLRAVIVEVERTTDHVLLVTHRSVARVLLAYFLGLSRDEVAGLDVPLGVLYMLEPKPYGVDFKAYRYNPQTNWFDYIPDFKLRQTHTI